jgi:hypothetical protein
MNGRIPFRLLLMMIGLLVAVVCGACDSSDKKEKVAEAPDPVWLDFKGEIARVREDQDWSKRKSFVRGSRGEVLGTLHRRADLKMNREILRESLDMGTRFLVKCQKPDGNFRYQYDWLTKTWQLGDSQVRQAGALWGLALCHRYNPTAETREAILKGFDFWFDQTIPGPDGTLTARYKTEDDIGTGSIALLALAIIEYLETDQEIPSDYRQELTTHLDGYLGFLQWMQFDKGRFAKQYDVVAGTRVGFSSPYYDGETLLCLARAARYPGNTELVSVVERAARATGETNTIDAWAKNPDAKSTKGFFQWGSMAFVEYYESRWKDYELFGDVTLALTWWMIYTHKTLERTLNTAYALEGLISGYRIAKQRGDAAACVDLLYVIDTMLCRLTSWQINGPLMEKNEFLVQNPTQDESAIGGVMNAAAPAKTPYTRSTYHELRVDVTQHQMHAVILALRHVYMED